MFNLLRGLTAPAWLVGLARGVTEAAAFAGVATLVEFVATGGLPDELQPYGALVLVVVRTLEGALDNIDPAKRRSS
jgi:hypothetical protein